MVFQAHLKRAILPLIYFSALYLALLISNVLGITNGKVHAHVAVLLFDSCGCLALLNSLEIPAVAFQADVLGNYLGTNLLFYYYMYAWQSWYSMYLMSLMRNVCGHLLAYMCANSFVWILHFQKMLQPCGPPAEKPEED